MKTRTLSVEALDKRELLAGDSFPNHDDPIVMAEHSAFLELVPDDTITDTAVGGAWSMSSTWADGTVPEDGEVVLIPEGVSVEVYEDIDARLENVKVEGALVFAPGEQNSMIVETLLINPTGSLIIGTEEEPAYTTITILDDGPIDFENDPTFLRRGLLSHGHVEMFGEVIESGRQLHPGNNPYRNEDEIVFGAFAPEFDHTGMPVLAMDRSIVIESENVSGDHQRNGHIMFMHNDDVSISGIRVNKMGRNDKSLSTTDGTGENERGRYSMHFHRTGTQGDAIQVSGSVVENGPGWGFVNHASNVVFTDNLSYNVKGSGFVAEIGSEEGAFVGNYAGRSMFTDLTSHNGNRFILSGNDKFKDDPSTVHYRGAAANGHGFWTQSTGVEIVDNFAWGHSQEAIFVHSRPFVEPGRTRAARRILDDGTEVLSRDMPFYLEGNKVYGSGSGIGIRWHRSPGRDPAEGGLVIDTHIENVRYTGFNIGYTDGITIDGATVIGNESRPIDAKPEDDNLAENRSAVGRGFHANRNSHNINILNSHFAGWGMGIDALVSGTMLIEEVTFGTNIEDISIANPQALFGEPRVIEINETEGDIDFKHHIKRSPIAGGSKPEQEIDAFFGDDVILMDGDRIYSPMQDPDAIPFVDSDPAFVDIYKNMTNQDLFDAYGVSFGNTLPRPVDDPDPGFDFQPLREEVDELIGDAAHIRRNVYRLTNDAAALAAQLQLIQVSLASQLELLDGLVTRIQELTSFFPSYDFPQPHDG